MTFADIASGASLFVDANTLVYHFAADPLLGPACRQLLHRIHGRDILGFTSTHVLSDLAHRMMTIEAMQLFGWPAAGVSRRLRRHPAEIQKLVLFRDAVEGVHRFGVQVVPVTPRHVSAAAEISQQHGLLSGDALVVAVMREHGLVHLASHDADFDRVAGLTRYSPA
jgi:predicted nucleic acid-binding protein